MPSVTLTTPTNSSVPTAATDSPFYEEPPFIVGMVVLAIILCFVVLIAALCLVRPSHVNSSDRYDTLRSEKGSPLREDGTVGSGWTPRIMTVS